MRPSARLKLYSTLFTLFAVLWAQSFSVYASSGKIVTADVSAEVNHLFDVEIGVSSDKVMSAATFSISYDKSVAEFREVKVNAPGSEAKAYDKNGNTTVVFLCENGLILNNTPLIFTLRYKLLKKTEPVLTVSASDCVNADAKNFEPPAKAACKVSCASSDSKRASYSSRSRSSVFGRSYKYKDANSSVKSKTSAKYTEDENAEEEASDSYEEDVSLTKTKDNDFPFSLAFGSMIVLAAIAALVKIYKKPDKDDES